MGAQIIQFRPRANPNRDRLNELKRMAEELLARIQIPDNSPCERNPDDCA
jgi:hypothetical protein